MSTETATPPAATPGVPEGATPPITKTAREMTAAAFNEPAPTQPTKPSMPAAKPKDAAQPAPKTETPPAKTEAKTEPAKADTPPVKTEAAPAAPEWPGEKLELPANASAEAKTNFASMKASMKQEWLKEKNARAEAEKQLAVRAAAAPADTAELERLRAEHKAAQDRLAVFDLQSHPDFVKQFVQPKEKAMATVKEVMEYQTTPKDTGELAVLLGKPMKDFNAAVSEITKDMNSADAATVATSLREARNIHAAEQSALSKSTELRSQLQAKTAQQQKQAFEAVATEVTSSLKRIEITDGMSADEKAASASYNQRLDSLRASAEKRAFGNITEREVARMAFESEQLALMREHIVPGLERRFAAQNQVISDLTAQIESLRGTRAPANAGGGGDANQAPAKKTRAEMIAAAYPGQRV